MVRSKKHAKSAESAIENHAKWCEANEIRIGAKRRKRNARTYQWTWKPTEMPPAWVLKSTQ